MSMLAILNAVFGLSLLFVLPVYVMYFTALHYFGKAFAREHPDLYARFAPPIGAPFQHSYAALQALQKNKALLSGLSPAVQEHFRSTYRYLLLGVAGFMVMLFAGLGSALVAKA